MIKESINPIKKLFNELLIPVGEYPVCIDDRPGKDMGDLGNLTQVLSLDQLRKGPKMLGASLVLLPVLTETAPVDQVLDMGEMIDYVKQAHEKSQLKMAVHMDDEHGHLNAKQVIEKIEAVDNGGRIPGCGFAGLLVKGDNPLGLNQRSQEFFKDNLPVEAMVKAGAKLTILTGNHAPIGKVDAVRNKVQGKTVDQVAAASKDKPTYSHDDLLVEGLLANLVAVLRESDKDQWADDIKTRANELNYDWLDKTTMILAGKTATQI